MKEFDEIIASITKELFSLKKINEELIEENNWLREQLGIPIRSNNELLIKDVFDKYYVEGDSNNKVKARIFNVMSREFECVGDLEGKSIYDLLKLRNLGSVSCAIIVIVLEHYGVHIKIPDLTEQSRTFQLLQIKEALQEYRKQVIFRE
ncbi:MAG: hypothetical protein J6K42_00875 [Clostridia bacterium]|nr:hypothetical protein [Clostridia bacterium]